jgi:hypothetical protein
VCITPSAPDRRALVRVGAELLPPPLRGVARQLGLIVVFTLPAVVLWWRAWSGGAGSTLRCRCLDPAQQVWFIAWPAYALLHGLNVFYSTWLWPSHGVNLLANASSPLIGVVLTPVTWAFGPFVATTLALTLAPGLSAWGCWLACRRFVAWWPACAIAALLFGYSPFVIQNVDQGHLGVALLVFPPLMLVVLHEILVRRKWSAERCGLALGLLLLGEFMVSQEILTLTVLSGAVGLAVCALAVRRRVAATDRFALRAFAVAALVALVTLAAPVWFMLEGPQHIRGSIFAGTPYFATSAAYGIWESGRYALQMAGFAPGTTSGPPVQFLGIGVLVGFALSLVLAWRRSALWVMAAVALVSTVFSWDNAVWLSPGHVVLEKWLPFQWIMRLPVIDNVATIHFAALADLAAALVIAMGIGATRSWRLWARLPARVGMAGIVALCVAAAAMLVPVWVSYQAPLVVEKVRLPPWYATVARTIPVGSVIATYPFPASGAIESQPLVWQVADGMRFRLAGGYVKVPSRRDGVLGTGPRGSPTWVLDTMTTAWLDLKDELTLTAAEVGHLRSALRQWDVSYVVVTNSGAVPLEAAGVFTATIGELPHVSHRAWVWDLRAQPIRTTAGDVPAAAAFDTCRAAAHALGVVPAGRPLSQTVNRCIVAGTTGG